MSRAQAFTHAELERELARDIGKRYNQPGRVVFVVNNDRSFLSHRASWASALQAAGSEILVVAEDTGRSNEIRALGFTFSPVAFGRESISPLRALAVALRVMAILISHRPRLVFLSATTAYTLGWPAALVLRKTTFVRLINGAGRAMTPASSRSTSSRIVRSSMWLSSRLKNCLSLFQIRADFDTFVEAGLANRSRSTIIGGTGIDLASWHVRAGHDHEESLRVLFAGRIFREKGIYEFIEIARRTSTLNIQFVVAGLLDDGVVTAVTAEEVDEWVAAELIDYLGHRTDMADVVSSCDVFLLPSTHPEGTPKALIEAAACGLVAIASDQPGCGAVIRDGETGWLLDPLDLDAWVERIVRLEGDRNLLHRMGEEAREKMIGEFSLEHVITALFEFAQVQPTESLVPSNGVVA